MTPLESKMTWRIYENKKDHIVSEHLDHPGFYWQIQKKENIHHADAGSGRKDFHSWNQIPRL